MAYGDPDAVTVGDYHLPNHVVYALTGAARAGKRDAVTGPDLVGRRAHARGAGAVPAAARPGGADAARHGCVGAEVRPAVARAFVRAFLAHRRAGSGLAGLAKAEPHALIVAALDPPPKVAGVVHLTYDPASQLDEPGDAGVQIVDGEEHLEVGLLVTSVNSDRQRLGLHLAAMLGMAGHPTQERAVEATGGIEVGHAELDV